ncbi:MAG TPA: energy transducer TonB [Bacteroidota bacterium]|nr:energy transducer TonB [Bacteroidota bacterium]
MNTTMNYGYQELQATYNQRMAKAMIVSILLILSIVAVYHLITLLQPTDEITGVGSTRIIELSQIPLPPSQGAPQTAMVTTASIKPSFGVPVPVPDGTINPDQTFADLKDLAAIQTTNGTIEEGTAGTIKIVIPPEEEPAPDTFIPMEVEPAILLRTMPVYPELAMKANLEGTVFVKMLVIKDGTVKKVFVEKSTEEIFNAAALDAAKKWVFRPAMMNNKPVAVWVSIPFKFYLKK